MAFEAEYAYEVDGDAPSGLASADLFEFSIGGRKHTRAVVQVLCKPRDGRRWLGRFYGDYDVPPALSTILTCPNNNEICVICAGSGFIVDILNPKRHEEIPIFPIVEALTCDESGILAFASFNRVCAFWNIGRIKDFVVADDGIEELQCESGCISGIGWESGNRGKRRFAFDIAAEALSFERVTPGPTC